MANLNFFGSVDLLVDILLRLDVDGGKGSLNEKKKKTLAKSRETQRSMIMIVCLVLAILEMLSIACNMLIVAFNL